MVVNRLMGSCLAPFAITRLVDKRTFEIKQRTDLEKS